MKYFGTSQFTTMTYIIGLIQVGLLAYWFTNSGLIMFLCSITFSIIFTASFLFLGRFSDSSLLDHFWITWGLGGFGMLLGHVIDMSLSHSLHLNHNNHFRITTGVELKSLIFSNMTIMMLIFCVPGCWFLCRQKLSNLKFIEKFIVHSVSGFFMLIGMVLSVAISRQFSLQIYAYGLYDYFLMVLIMALLGSAAYYSIVKYCFIKNQK